MAGWFQTVKKGRLSYVLEERERNVSVWQAH
jgi:hypothetical protein